MYRQCLPKGNFQIDWIQVILCICVYTYIYYVYIYVCFIYNAYYIKLCVYIICLNLIGESIWYEVKTTSFSALLHSQLFPRDPNFLNPSAVSYALFSFSFDSLSHNFSYHQLILFHNIRDTHVNIKQFICDKFLLIL